MTEATVANFDSEVLSGEGHAAVYYHASWCKTCKEMDPFLEAAEKEYEDVSFHSVNTDISEEIVAQQAIRTIPVLEIFREGKSVRMIRGPISEEEFKKSLSDAIGSD